MRFFVFLTLLCSSVFLYSSVAQSIPNQAIPNQAINAQNWKNHPRVLEVRGVVSAVENLLRTRQLKIQVKRLECAGIQETRTLWTDLGGKVRRLVLEWGSDDSALSSSYSYDGAGVLRFAYTRGGAVNGAEAEWRQYFGPEGRRFWTDYQWRKQQYTWPNVLGTQIRNPRVAFGTKQGC